jgi:hypothetical protein
MCSVYIQSFRWMAYWRIDVFKMPKTHWRWCREDFKYDFSDFWSRKLVLGFVQICNKNGGGGLIIQGQRLGLVPRYPATCKSNPVPSPGSHAVASCTCLLIMIQKWDTMPFLSLGRRWRSTWHAWSKRKNCQIMAWNAATWHAWSKRKNCQIMAWNAV